MTNIGYSVWNEIDPLGIYKLIFGPQLVELFKKDKDVWPYWERYISEIM